MQSSSHHAFTMPPDSKQVGGQFKTAEDRVYQAFSIAAMLLLLVSLWLF
jgi:hypothetical protein